LGGGEPIEKEIWFSKDAAEILKTINVSAEYKGDLITEK
jgi:hypothetical protein